MEHTQIIYKKKPSYNVSIIFGFPGKRIVNCSPGKDSVSEDYEVTTFAEVVTIINTWGKYLKRELEADDILINMLEDLNNDKYKFNDNPDKFFKESEKQQINSKINELKLNIINLNILKPNEVKQIEERLTDLVVKLDTLNEIDWRTICIGTFMTLIMQLTLSPEVGSKLWHLFLQFINTQFLLN